MALHHELVIYKAAYDLLGMAIDVTQNFPRDFKRTVGETIRTECTELMTLIMRANIARDKVPHLEQLLERIQVIEVLLRVAKDKRWIDVKKYAAAIEVTTSVSKQGQGWKKQSEEANAKAAPAA